MKDGSTGKKGSQRFLEWLLTSPHGAVAEGTEGEAL